MYDYRLYDHHYLFLIKARNSILALRYRPFNLIKNISTKCRHCGYAVETQAHVLNHCTATGPKTKHNAAMNAFREYLLELGFDVDIDRTPIELKSKLRPDLIIGNNTTRKTHILDIKVPYDDYFLFMANRVYNSRKYKDL